MKESVKFARIIKNYKYAVYPAVSIPEEVWEQGRSMNRLWNEMVECRERLIDDLKVRRETATGADATSAAPTEPVSLPSNYIKTAADRLIWKEFDRQLYEIARRADWKQQLGNDAREYVLSIFRTASITAFRTKGTLQRKSAGLSNIVIPHRFTEGGWPAERIYHHLSKKIHFDALPAEVFARSDWQSRRSRLTSGFYGGGRDNHPLPLRILQHRPLPAAGLIKTTQLIGTFDRLPRVWKWHLLIACQTETAAPPSRPRQPIAALDLGFRRMDDYLRVGYVVDTGGNEYELRLPIVEPPSRKLLNALRSVNGGRARNNLAAWSAAEFFPVTMFDVVEWQQRNDARIERIKEQITNILKDASAEEISEFSEETAALLNRLKLIRRTGLLKLSRLLTESDTGAAQRIRPLLDEWQKRDTETLIKIKTTNTRLINKRKKIYENIALWLHNNFSHLVIGKNFSLRKIVKSVSDASLTAETAALKASAKFRFFAALSFLQQKIREKTSNDWLLENDVPRAGLICHRCGAVAEPTARLVLVCPSGHEADQDAQACRNRLKELPGDFVFDEPPPMTPIPEHLKKFIVRIE